MNKSPNKATAKRSSDSGEEVVFKKLKFDKESILADLSFKKRTIAKNDDYVTAGQTPSEAETEIDTESVPRLLADNVAIKYGFKDANDKKPAGEGTEKKVLRDEIASSEMMSGRSTEGRKIIKLVMRFVWENTENEANESSTHNRPVSRRRAIAVATPRIDAPKSTPGLNMSATKQQVEKEIATKEATKAGKTPSSYLESPVSPKNSPDVRSSASDSLFALKIR
jgi:hypothetical protein